MRYGGPDAYKRNHYVPAFMLRYWEQQHEGHFGVWTYRVDRHVVSFESSRGRRPFRFAAVEDLYVPIINGQRAKALEAGWFNGLETALAPVVDCAHRQQPLALRRRDFAQFTMALFSLEQRSRYVLEALRQLIESDPTLRARVSASPERSCDRLVLENLVHVTTHLADSISPLRCKFVHAGPSDFIVADRPGFNNPALSSRFMVLTNKVAVAYERADDEPEYTYVDADAEFVGVINETLAKGARDWIVAVSPNDAANYGSINRSPEAEAQRQSEQIIPIDHPFLLSGVTIPPDGA